MKNAKKVFFITILVMLLIGLTAISAANDTSQDSTTSKNRHIEQNTVQKDTTVIKNTEKQKVLTKNNNKTVKQDTSTIDYYVSDNTGSDTNTGTSESPFKTIQTALDKTSADNTYNIHILEGTYKGQGNTNLTVNGNYNINLIGSGINKTIFDGEAKYDILYPVNNQPFYWGSSENWYYFENETGNWFMNVTDGYGKITIKNIKITKMYSKGAPGQYHSGDAINLYPTANIDNYGKLEIDNVLFDQNYGGVGSAIRNNNKATLTVNNSEFKNNQKSSASGNNGILYNNGTATVVNSNFHDNFARWGTILNDKTITVINTTFKDNNGYDGGSDFKFGSGFAFNSGVSDFFNTYEVFSDSTIINSTFINCDQTSIYGTNGNLTLSGNKFIDTAGIKLTDNNTYENKYDINDNIFNNIDDESIVLNLEILNNNLSIENNQITKNNGTIISTYSGKIKNNKIITNKNSGTININKISSKDELITTIEDNNIQSTINIYSNNNIIKNNNISSDSDYAIKISNSARKNTVVDNYIVSSKVFGDYAVDSSSYNTVENNTPKVSIESIFASPDITEIRSGTIDDPTTLNDALTKVEDNGVIVLLPGTNGTYTINTPIEINNEKVKQDTKTFTLTGFLYDITLTAENQNNILQIGNDYTITLENLTLTKGNADKGGLIYTEGNLTCNNITFTDSSANQGGAIYAINNPTITLTNNKFNNITSQNETLNLNDAQTTFQNNTYQNISITFKKLEIESNSQNPETIGINDTVTVNILPIELEHPQYYDNNILTNITYYIFENDEITQETKDNNYNINTTQPITIITYIQPTNTKETSNKLTFEITYEEAKNVIITNPDMLIFTNSTKTMTTTITDENELLLNDGEITYKINDEIIGTSNIQNSKASITLPNNLTEGEYNITLTYTTTSGKYNTQTANSKLYVSDAIYVGPNVTAPDLGTIDNPTTLTDALKRIENDKTIILLPEEYLVDNNINITEQTTPNAKKFTITGYTQETSFNGQHKTSIFTINQNYQITFNNITIKNGYSTNADIGSVFTNHGTLILNNSIIKNNNGVRTIRSQRLSTLIFQKSNIIVNNTNTQGTIFGQQTNVTIDENNQFINNENKQAGVLYFTIDSVLTINNNNKFKNNNVTMGTSKANGAAIYISRSILQIKENNEFINNTAGMYGGVIFITSGYKVSINGSKFINNTALMGGVISDSQGTGTLSLTNNLFEDNFADNGAVLYKSFDSTGTFSVINNIFVNNTSDNPYPSNPKETSILSTGNNQLTENTYINTQIDLTKFILTSPQQEQTIKSKEDITLNIDIALKNPRYYDADILEKTTYMIFINGENKYNTTEKEITINEEYTSANKGILNIQIKASSLTNTSNNITIQLIQTSSIESTIENPIIGESTKLIATLVMDEGTPVNGGVAIFKVNGKTLRDNDGNVIYVPVVDGKAELPDVNITAEWMKPDTSIQAVYSGTDEYDSIITEKTYINVTKPEATISITSPTESVAPGQTVTLTASVTDNNVPINSGRVVFKLNGKTLKDENGKALYVNVVNGVANVTYTLPVKTKANTYKLTAVYTDSMYDRVQADVDFVVTA